jgi:periplasmic protein TonB
LEGNDASPKEESDMAYADNRRGARLSPHGLAGALGMSGALAALIATMAPDMLPDAIKEPPIRLIDLPIKPLPPEPDARKTADPAQETRIATPQRPPMPMPPGGEIPGQAPPQPPFPPLPPGPGVGASDPPPLPVRIGASVDPRYAAALQPAYPPGLARAEIEGKVTVRVLVGADGRVKAVEPVRFDEEDFLAATRRQALARWRFKPATLDGVPVESWKEMTVRFVMPD